MEKLQKPFIEEEIEYKIGSKNSDHTMGLALAYVKARAIQSRLDEVLGIENWAVKYKEISGGFLCALSVKFDEKWITKEDGAPVTDFESVKGGISNSFKRVASSGYGIGRYLYRLKDKWYPIKQQGRGYVFIEKPKTFMDDEITMQKNDSKHSKSEKNELESYRRIKITFGKYSGFTLGDIFDKDRAYFKYIQDKGRDSEIITACKVLEELSLN